MKLEDQLQGFAGQRAWFDPMAGNHGDALISIAAQSMLGAAQITLHDDVKTADCIVISGGGSMVDGWGGLKKLREYSRRFPGKPLTVLPSSFYSRHADIAAVFRDRTAESWLWAREPASLDILQAAGLPAGVQLGLEHDLAFGLAGHPLISSLPPVSKATSILIVERDDWEGPTGRKRPLSPPGLSFIPQSLRTAVRKRLIGPIRRRQDRNSAFNRAALAFLAGNGLDIGGHSVVCADVSLPEVIDFHGFLESIANAAVIVTTRLHVAIIAHLIRRQCYLVEGNYHKYRGVFDYSLGVGNTELLRWTGEKLVPA